jgi:hypothetical protein
MVFKGPVALLDKTSISQFTMQMDLIKPTLDLILSVSPRTPFYELIYSL